MTKFVFLVPIEVEVAEHVAKHMLTGEDVLKQALKQACGAKFYAPVKSSEFILVSSEGHNHARSTERA